MKRFFESRVFKKYLLSHFFTVLVVTGLAGLNLFSLISNKIEKEMLTINTNRVSYIESIVEKSVLEPAEMLVLDQLMSAQFVNLQGSYAHLELHQFIKSQISSMPFVESINIYYPKEKLLISSNGVKYDYTSPINDKTTCKQRKSSESCWTITQIAQEEHGNGLQEEGLITYAKSAALKSGDGPLYILYVNVYIDNIKQILTRQLVNNQEALVILSNDGKVITQSTSAVPRLADLKPDSFERALNSEQLSMIKLQNLELMQFFKESPYTGWKYVLLMPTSDFFRVPFEIRSVILMISASALVLGALLAIVFAINHYKPLRLLAAKLKGIPDYESKMDSNEYILIEQSIQHLNYSVANLKAQVIENNLNQLLHGTLGFLDEKEFLTGLRGEMFVVVMYALDEEISTSFCNWDKKVREKLLEAGVDVFLTFYSKRKLAATFNFNLEDRDRVFRYIAQSIHIPELSPKPLICAVGPIVQAAELHLSCEGALEAMKHRYLVHGELKEPLIYEAIHQLDHFVASGLYEDIALAMKNNQIEKVRRRVKTLTEQLSERMYRYESVELVLYQIIPMIAEKMMENNPYEESRSTNARQLADELFRRRNVFEAFAWLIELIEGMLDAQRFDHVTKMVMQSVKSYIDEHYHQEISLEILSQKTFMSSSYISQLFKKTFGIGVSEYVSQVRLDKAKDMLEDQALKIERIAELVGMSNSTYFITKFKKRFGLTPNQYRMQYKAKIMKPD
ncbi:HTH-type transcriptional regulator YesS [Paenibacillus konkukensis]|uniref:HTH-type transcriptional regulator YesS n=1 Tax=Paenibacillus konkukensis TaxID=2020716 RepID=A0ABY4RX98_9BACL|nr:helix-turn-helix domain-containing protein [Paenibacillus konkukensis]UQZ86374.1 HTH-type transcriptional regulator YesS [Paenibacillus konkukensis]